MGGYRGAYTSPEDAGSIVCFVHKHGFTLTLEIRAFLPSRLCGLCVAETERGALSFRISIARWRLVDNRPRTRRDGAFSMRARTRCATRQNTGHAWGGPPGALAPADCRKAGFPVPHERIIERTTGARAPPDRDAPVMNVSSEAAWATATPATSNVCAQALDQLITIRRRSSGPA